jgi:hypothetical protein
MRLYQKFRNELDRRLTPYKCLKDAPASRRMAWPMLAGRMGAVPMCGFPSFLTTTLLPAQLLRYRSAELAKITMIIFPHSPDGQRPAMPPGVAPLLMPAGIPSSFAMRQAVTSASRRVPDDLIATLVFRILGIKPNADPLNLMGSRDRQKERGTIWFYGDSAARFPWFYYFEIPVMVRQCLPVTNIDSPPCHPKFQ